MMWLTTFISWFTIDIIQCIQGKATIIFRYIYTSIELTILNNYKESKIVP